MPTGYTAMIENGKVNTGKEFLKVCIREFGCCIGQRDDPLSAPLVTEIKPDSYYKEQYDKAIKELEEFDKKLPVSRKAKLLNDKKEELEDLEKSIEENKRLIEKYERIKSEVEQWIPPTSDHGNIKEFALDQIRISIPDMKYYYDRRNELLNESLQEKYAEYVETRRRDDILRDINYYKEQMEKEEERIASRNKFLKQFIDSLEEMK